jgi:hypothetical protein
MTKIVKNFNGFSKVYENDMSVDKSAEIIDKAKKEMPLEDVATDAAQLVNPNNSDISDKMIQAAQAQAQPEPDGLPVTVRESVYSGEDLINPVVMDNVMKSAITRLPALTTKSEIYQRGRKFLVPEGSCFLPDSFAGGKVGYTIYYKDKNGKYDDVYLNFNGSAEDIQHLKNIFEDLAKKSKWKNFVDKTVTIAGPTLAAVGFGLAIFGMIKFQYMAKANDAWLASGGGGESSGGGFSWDKIAPMGGYESAIGGGLFVTGVTLLGLTSVTDAQRAAIDESISKLAAVLKAFLEPLGIKLTDLKSAADISAVLNTNVNDGNGGEADVMSGVPVARVDSKLRESRTYKRK